MIVGIIFGGPVTRDDNSDEFIEDTILQIFLKQKWEFNSSVSNSTRASLVALVLLTRNGDTLLNLDLDNGQITLGANLRVTGPVLDQKLLAKIGKIGQKFLSQNWPKKCFC